MNQLKTDPERVDWSRRYGEALRTFLRQGKSGSLLPAARLGSQATTLGLETLDVAKVHEQALDAMAAAEGSLDRSEQDLDKRGYVFFREVIVPIEETHRAARKADADIDRLSRKLQRRATESTASDEQLEQAVSQREAAEASSDAHEVQSDKMIAELQRRQKHLRNRLRGIMSEQEGGRKAIGGELRNEIAQALLAIHLSLLALKTSGHVDTEKAEKSIDEAQRILQELQHKGHLLAQQEDRI